MNEIEFEWSASDGVNTTTLANTKAHIGSHARGLLRTGFILVHYQIDGKNQITLWRENPSDQAWKLAEGGSI